MIDLKTGKIIRNYVFEKRIGMGGVGEVWCVRHKNLNKRMAIKRILPHLCNAPKVYDRFLLEALAMAGLEHPNIVGIHDFFTEAGEPFLVMSHINGGSLQDRLKGNEGMSQKEILDAACEILHALDFAHRNRIIHRDVKPSNILLSRDGHAYLVDFGIALVLGKPRATKYGTNIGTPEYMSPEQIRGRRLDHLTDVYSIGCVLYEMLTGCPPFGASDDHDTNDFEIMERHINERPTRIRLLNPEVDPRTEDIVMRAMAKNKLDRSPGCAQMAASLAQVGNTGNGFENKKGHTFWKVAAGTMTLAALLAGTGWFMTHQDIAPNKLARLENQLAAALEINRKKEAETTALKLKIESLGKKSRPRRTLKQIIEGQGN